MNTPTDKPESDNSGKNVAKITEKKQSSQRISGMKTTNTSPSINGIDPAKITEVKPPKLTRKQKAFADYLLNNPKASATSAYRENYNATSETGIRVEASRTLAKPSVIKYLELHGDKAIADMIEIAEYSKRLGKSKPSYAAVAVTANKDIIDRAYGKATQRVEVSTKKVSININLSSVNPVDKPLTDTRE